MLLATPIGQRMSPHGFVTKQPYRLPVHEIAGTGDGVPCSALWLLGAAALGGALIYFSRR